MQQRGQQRGESSGKQDSKHDKDSDTRRSVLHSRPPRGPAYHRERSTLIHTRARVPHLHLRLVVPLDELRGKVAQAQGRLQRCPYARQVRSERGCLQTRQEGEGEGRSSGRSGTVRGRASYHGVLGCGALGQAGNFLGGQWSPVRHAFPLAASLPFTLPTPPPVLPDPEFRQLEPPIALVGEVVPGFGRGSKELGIPTANLDPATLGPAMDGVVPGIYCGWASVEGSPPYKAVASIGLCVISLFLTRFVCVGVRMCPRVFGM